MDLFRKSGFIIIVVSLIIWVGYLLFIFLPAFTTNVNNPKLIGEALTITLILGGFAAITSIITGK
ncbi:MAG: hypothetical protein NTU63_03930 [Candidatus Pacearchaeota archaeon]|nr:hypothetical protein [Candidatus Pacearchaeota archaeon]